MSTPGSDQTSEELVNAILRAVRGLRYGTLEVVIHDSKIVRIERHERIRIDVPADSEQKRPTATAEANSLQPGLTVTGRKTSGSEKQ